MQRKESPLSLPKQINEQTTKTTGQFQITGDKEHPLSYQKEKMGFKLA